MKKFSLCALAALMLVFGLPYTSEATPITYNVLRTITDTVGTNPDGSLGTVVGTITTDGTIGALTTGSFLAWSLLLNDGAGSPGPITINQSNSTFKADGLNLVASATQITFDFSATGDAIFDNPNHFGEIYWGLEGVSGGIIGAGDGYETVRDTLHEGWSSISYSGTTQVVAMAAVPEPTTILLLGLGLIGLAGVRRKFQN